MLQHQHTVTDAEGQRSAGSALPGYHHDDRNRESGHLNQVVGDGLGLAPFLCIEPRIRSGSIDE